VKPWRHTFLTNGIIFTSGLASGIIAARLLGPEDRGHLAAVIYWPHFVAGVAAMGINEAITIRTAKTGATGTLRSTTLALSLTLALLAVVVALPLLPWLLGSSRQDSVLFTQIYFAAFVPLSFIAMNFLAVEQGQFNYRRFNVQRIIQALAYPALLVVFWLAGALTVQTAAIAVLAGTAIVALIRLWQGGAELKAAPSLSEARELVVQGVRLHATNLAMFVAMQVDKMALVLFASDLQLGLYVVATTAASVTQSLLVQTYNNVMLPAAAKSGSEENSVAAIINTLRKLIALLLLATVLMVVLLPLFLPLVFGDEFSDAVPYAQVLAVAFAFVGLKSALIYLFRAWAVNKPGIAAEGLASVVMLVGAYPVLGQWGPLGLAMLVLVAHGLGVLLLLAWFMRHTKFGVKQLLTR
jgi:O-antigen/teichoic acid export membrane protein